MEDISVHAHLISTKPSKHFYCLSVSRSWWWWEHRGHTTGPGRSRCTTWLLIRSTAQTKTTSTHTDTATLVRSCFWGELIIKNKCIKGACDRLPSVSPGYAVTAGHFSAPNVIDIAAGAPQHSGSGKVRTLNVCHVYNSPGVQLLLCR